jgi:hypothetical protein
MGRDFRALQDVAQGPCKISLRVRRAVCDNAPRMHLRREGSTTKNARRTLAVTLALTLVGAAGALAAGPLKGKTYEGAAPSSGVDSRGHPQPTHTAGRIVLKVAGNGRSVAVRFSSSLPVFYCASEKALFDQTTGTSRISSGGAFRAKIDQRFTNSEGTPGIVQVVSGRFSGRKVTGTIHTEAGGCGGTATFTAAVR